MLFSRRIVVGMLSLWLLGCPGGTTNDGNRTDAEAGAPDVSGDAATGDVVPGDVSPDAGAQTPLLDEALGCAANPKDGVTPGEDLYKLTLTGDDVICNDGSAPVMYVRRAESADDEANWVFHLQGGGGCGSTDCAARWCTRTEKMTTRATPPSMKGKGIMKRGGGNSLGSANQVFIYYCSSDNWAGTTSDAVVEATADTPAFRLHFRGENIVNAALDALEAGATSDDGSQTLPPLSGAGWALWTGTSGGCQGVMNTADRVAARLSALGISPWIICDANFSPDIESLPEGNALDTYVAVRKERFAISSSLAKVRLDDSCTSALADEDRYLCDWPGYVLGNHVVGAPLFVRMALADRSISEAYLDAGFSIQEFAQGVADTMQRASTGAGRETPPRPVSVYGPGCEQHVGLTNDDWFLTTTIEVNGVQVTFHDAVVAWMNGTDVVAVDTVPPTLSVCGEVTDELD